MSRLIDDLNRVAKVVPAPMGFRASRPAAAGPRLRLVAGLAGVEGADPAGIEGADAVLLRLTKGLGVKALQKMAGKLPEIPWGCWLEDAAAEKLKTLVEAGADFVVMTPSGPVAAAPQDDKTGKILQVDASLEDGLIRAVNDLPVDVVLAAGAATAATWEGLMRLQRLANLLDKPLLVPVPAGVTADELRRLWEAGVDGVVWEADGTAGKLRELRRAVEAFPPRSRKKEGAQAILPRLSAAPGAPPEEEEGDDGDDE
jgi:hypothetical protein